MTWRVDLPNLKPLSMNDRVHWARGAAQVKHARHVAGWMTRLAKIPPQAKVSIELHYIPGVTRRRDPLNLVKTLKACEDGVVDAGVIPDDTAQYSKPTMPIIDPVQRGTLKTRLYLIITPEETP